MYGSGKGYIEGVEYHRMGMTNALVRQTRVKASALISSDITRVDIRYTFIFYEMHAATATLETLPFIARITVVFLSMGPTASRFRKMSLMM